MLGGGGVYRDGLSQTSFLLCRWSVPLYPEIVFLHCSARLVIRCRGRVLSEQEIISFLCFLFLGVVFFFVLFCSQKFLYSFFRSLFFFFFNARLDA